MALSFIMVISAIGFVLTFIFMLLNMKNTRNPREALGNHINGMIALTVFGFLGMISFIATIFKFALPYLH